MNLNLTRNLKFAAFVASIAIVFAGCQKDANTSKPVKATATAAPSLASLMDTAAATKSFYISNCGLATLPTPVAGNGTVIMPVGRILAFNQPAGEAPLPSSIAFGPAAGSLQGNISPYGAPKYTLTLQGDGNLVLYLTGSSTSLWNTRTATGGANKNINCYLVLGSDGNLVLQDRLTTGGLAEYWASHDVLCPGQQAPVLILQSDGNIVEEYPCAHIGTKTYGFIGNTGTGGGNGSNHNGSF